MIYFDSSHDSGEIEVLLVKIRARVLDLWLDVSWTQVVQMWILGPRPQGQDIL